MKSPSETERSLRGSDLICVGSQVKGDTWGLHNHYYRDDRNVEYGTEVYTV